ncbi:hypothetical protein pb186bvf_021197 [Paramecium bursaria]
MQEKQDQSSEEIINLRLMIKIYKQVVHPAQKFNKVKQINSCNFRKDTSDSRIYGNPLRKSLSVYEMHEKYKRQIQQDSQLLANVHSLKRLCNSLIVAEQRQHQQQNQKSMS